MERVRVSELEREVDAERYARQQVEELFNARCVEIKAKVVEHYREFPEYHGELTVYDAGAFMTYFDGVTWAITGRG